MKVQVEARPLHEPLAGGAPGATVSVEPLIAGHLTWPRSAMERTGGRFETLRLMRDVLGGRDEVEVPCPAYLLRHPSAGAILVDTGLHPSVASDPRGNLGRLGNRYAQPRLEPGEDVPARLRERGLEASEIPILVMTHLHFDHSSAISEFPHSTIVVSEREWKAAATGPRPLLNGYRRNHLDYAFDYRAIDFDRAGIDSYASFGRTFDLFGDGSVRIAYTPGHSAGHTSVIARLGRRDFVIGGDATYTLAQLEGEGPPPPRPFDAHNYRRSLQELRLFRSQYPDSVVTPGHDPEFLAGLDSKYE